jgi:hypothetical protein
MLIIEKDQDLYGASPNAKAFVLVSDGQAWTGEVARSLRVARGRDIPVFVVGVGTTSGGRIPEPPPNPREKAAPQPPVHSSLDRASLAMIANAGGGDYMELDREGDREIANHIIDAARRRAGARGVQVENEELYWRCLLAAAVFMGLGLLFLQERVELWLQAAGAGVALAVVWTLTR